MNFFVALNNTQKRLAIESQLLRTVVQTQANVYYDLKSTFKSFQRKLYRWNWKPI